MKHRSCASRSGALKLAALVAWAFVALAGCHTPPPRDAPPSGPALNKPPILALPLNLHFTDVTAAAGIKFQQSNGAHGAHNFLETTGSGACWFDYNNDGWMDLYLVQNGPLPGSPGFGPGGNRLFRNNRDGTFSDVTQQAGVAGHGYGQGCCAADIDNDGYVDLFVTCYGHNILYHNNCNGTFTDITEKAGLANVGGWSTSAGFADYDNDGYVDLYVGHYCNYKVGEDPHCAIGLNVYSYCPPTQFKGESGRLYHNNGNGTFTDVTQKAGLYQPDGKNLGVVWGDFNDDNKIDLFVTNDNRRNSLFQNNGDGTFTDVALKVGVALGENGHSMAGMGTDMADYDNDGRLDLVAANYSDQPNELWHNETSGTFNDVTFPAQIGPPSLPYVGFGATFADIDLDGWKDLVVSNGHVMDNISAARQDLTFAEPGLFYHNNGNGTFSDSSHAVGPDFLKPRVGRGLCVADYDNDGDLDLLLTPLNGPATLLRNDGGNRHHWLSVRCVGTKDNRDGIGARVTVTTGSLRQVAEVHSACSYLSQNDPRLYFGLGKATRVDHLEVRWPNGDHSERSNLTANQAVKIVQN